MSEKVIDVLIVGAGPTGTALAIDLARRGLDIRIVDKAATVFSGSRAKGVQPRTLEVLQDLGALEDVMTIGIDYPPLGIHLGPLVIPWRMISQSKRTADVPYPNTRLIPQCYTDCALHERLKTLGRRVEFGKELVSLTQDDEKATGKVTGAEGTESISARYVVSAEGGSSSLRRELNIDFIGTTHDEDRMIIVDARTTGLSRSRWHIWPGSGGRFVGACPLPPGDLFQWMIRLGPEETPNLSPGVIRERIQERIKDPRVRLQDIHWKSVFRPNIRLAEHYRKGRVFLAGDTAHVHAPAGAQGLNTGIQDAYNLGWKLAQVLAGANSELLDSYEAERQPIAAAVLKLSTKKYDGIAKLDPSSLRRGTQEKQLALTYRGGPLASDKHARTSTLQAGDRAPDAELIASNGSPARLFETFIGPHFTAIAYGNGAALALDELDWPTTGAALKRVFVEVTTAHPSGAVFRDDGNTFRRHYGVTGDTLLLIRPDGYIGHIASGDRLNTLHAAASRMTPTTQAPGSWKTHAMAHSTRIGE